MLAVALVCSVSLFAQEGIQFTQGSWTETLAKAKKENKIIFVDAFTTWCGPCKWMAANAFVDKAAGEFYNKNFINAKIDMEKGEGVEMAKEFEVMAYPTLLFINGDGDLVHRSVGALDAESLLILGGRAIDPEQQLIGFINKYKNGNREPEFLKTYAGLLEESGMSGAQEVANTYLKGQENLLTEDNIQFIYDYTYVADDAYYGFMVKNKDKFYKIIGKEEVNQRFKDAILYPKYRAQDVDLAEIKTALSEVFSTKEAAQFTDEFEMTYYAYRLRSDEFRDKYLAATVAYMEKYDIKDWEMLNSTAWTVFENTDDKDILEKACAWAEKSVKLDSNLYNNDTVAWICMQMGKKSKAKKFAEEAIKLGKAAGQDVSGTEELLEKL